MAAYCVVDEPKFHEVKAAQMLLHAIGHLDKDRRANLDSDNERWQSSFDAGNTITKAFQQVVAGFDAWVLRAILEMR